MMYQQMRMFLSGRQVIDDDQYTNILDSVSILNICFLKSSDCTLHISSLSSLLLLL